jgi:hypothetical protein
MMHIAGYPIWSIKINLGGSLNVEISITTSLQLALKELLNSRGQPLSTPTHMVAPSLKK